MGCFYDSRVVLKSKQKDLRLEMTMWIVFVFSLFLGSVFDFQIYGANFFTWTILLLRGFFAMICCLRFKTSTRGYVCTAKLLKES